MTARTVNEGDRAAKRAEILDAALALILAKGYERLTVRDLCAEVGMSNGAFFHYFASKPAVLEALIGRLQEDAERALVPLLDDPSLPAPQKLAGFFASLQQAGLQQRALVADMLRVWLSDENAIVREKVQAAIRRRRGPLLARIVRQGVREGSLAAPDPELAAEVVLALARGLGDVLVERLLRRDGPAIVAAYAAFADAVERALGAPPGSLPRPGHTDVQGLVSAWHS
jgi:TetR/AcrR family transcriptional repressor of nem operon